MQQTYRRHLWAILGYAAVAAIFTWPLLPNIGTHLTGPPDGDTGVYVWNQWVFQHEILDNHRSPYFTDKILSLRGRRANLSLHNYTAFQDLLALPLQPWLGVVAAFNTVYLLMTVLTGYATFLLVRHVTGAWAEAWLAGLLFAWSPVLVTRGGAHFSLVAAAPLALFMLILLRATDRQRLRDAAALGLACAWAATTDAYYAVYCIILAGFVMFARVVTVTRSATDDQRRTVPWTLDVLLCCVAGLVATMLISGGWQFTLLGRVTSIRGLYTPMLLLTLLACARLAWPYRPNLPRYDSRSVARVLRLVSAAGLVTAVLLSPVLFAAAMRVVEGHWEGDRVFWRSSPLGIDLASLVLPNPNHPLAPASLRAWLTPRPDAYYENVASITFVALFAMLTAWRAGWKIPRLWGGLAIAFAALSLGPFIHIAGVNTYIPGPWAILRYAPIIGLARTPARFSIMVMLMIAVLFGAALCWIGQRWPARRRSILATVTVLLLFELLPAPRPIYSAAVPRIFTRIAAVQDDTAKLLELPFGVRDGTRSVGNFSARSQYFQTVHRKPLIGGYLSRVSRRRIAEMRRDPMLNALIWLSEGRDIDESRRPWLVARGLPFIESANVGFVVIDTDRTPPALRAFAIDAFQLRLVDVDGSLELFEPARLPTLHLRAAPSSQ